MQKLMLAGDIHGDFHHARYLIDRAVTNGVRTIFQVGDFGYWEHQQDGIDFLDDLSKELTENNIDLYFLDGNHDKTSLLLKKYKELDDEGFIIVRDRIKYAPRGHRWTWDSVKFIALGGAYSVDKDYRIKQEKAKSHKISEKNMYRPASGQKSTDTTGLLWFPEEEMSDIDMDNILQNRNPVDIILAHDKPRSSNPYWNRKDLEPCWPNQDRMQRAVVALQPKYFVHGHLHFKYSDKILCGDGRYTEVLGLDCNPDVGGFGSRASNSWCILDLNSIDISNT